MSDSQSYEPDADSITYDNLLAGSQKDVVTRSVTINKGQLLGRGALVMRITSGGLWVEAEFSNKAAADDFGILCAPVDTLDSGATQVAEVFVEGQFADGGVSFFYGDTASTWGEYLAEQHAIYLKPTVGVGGVFA